MRRCLTRFWMFLVQEINKIIQELWLLTYKGEDISSIQIESGHESGSGAKVSLPVAVLMSFFNCLMLFFETISENLQLSCGHDEGRQFRADGNESPL